jgi:hypothetical protein
MSCLVCFSVPDEFSFDPVSKTYGDPQRRPEIRSATIEFIAPSEYMVGFALCILVSVWKHFTFILFSGWRTFREFIRFLFPH